MHVSSLHTGLLSQYGNLKKLVKLVELLANHTYGEISNITVEMVVIRSMVLQNRIALEYVLAAQGGVCELVNTECCMYIPYKSESVEQHFKHIQDVAEHSKKIWGTRFTDRLSELFSG